MEISLFPVIKETHWEASLASSAGRPQTPKKASWAAIGEQSFTYGSHSISRRAFHSLYIIVSFLLLPAPTAKPRKGRWMPVVLTYSGLRPPSFLRHSRVGPGLRLMARP